MCRGRPAFIGGTLKLPKKRRLDQILVMARSMQPAVGPHLRATSFITANHITNQDEV